MKRRPGASRHGYRRVKCLKCGYVWSSKAKSPRCHQGRVIVTITEGCSGYAIAQSLGLYGDD